MVNIIRAESEHVALIAPLFDAYRQFYRRAADADAAHAFIVERLQRDESVILLALDEEEPVGFVQLYPTFSSLSLGRMWILNDLFVTPAARRCGVGTALMQAAMDWARETGARGMTLATEVTNSNAQQLYERMGWQRNSDFYYYFLPLES